MKKTMGNLSVYSGFPSYSRVDGDVLHPGSVSFLILKVYAGGSKMFYPTALLCRSSVRIIPLDFNLSRCF